MGTAVMQLAVALQSAAPVVAASYNSASQAAVFYSCCTQDCHLAASPKVALIPQVLLVRAASLRICAGERYEVEVEAVGAAKQGTQDMQEAHQAVQGPTRGVGQDKSRQQATAAPYATQQSTPLQE